MTDIYSVAQALVGEVRTHLGEWRNPSERLCHVQRSTSVREGFSPVSAFTSLATAPATSVTFSANSCCSSARVSGSRGFKACAQAREDCSVSHPSSATRESNINAASCATHPAAVYVPVPDKQMRGVTSAVKPKPQLGKSPQIVNGCDSAERLDEGRVASPKNNFHLESSGESGSPATSFSGASRLRADAARLSLDGQQLFAAMQRSGGILMASGTMTDASRRRASGSQDAEVRRAVRDYLYRMNILASMEGEEVAALTSPALGDAVLNGSALCQLIDTLIGEGSERASRDPVPCRSPRTLDEVRMNYAAALAVLRGMPRSAQDLIPSAAWSMTPERVFLHTSPSALLALYVHLISTYLPAPEELPVWRPHLCWQPSADAAVFEPLAPVGLSDVDAVCRTFLHARGVLPDPAVYQLPGDECLLPSAVAAPFMATWSDLVARTTVPLCLCVPSIWPYLCNGVVLSLLARPGGGGVVGVGESAADCPAATPFYANPRTFASCAANIRGALRALQAMFPARMPLELVSEESVTAVMRGNRLHILRLLLSVRAVQEGRRAPAMRPALTHRRKDSVSSDMRLEGPQVSPASTTTRRAAASPPLASSRWPSSSAGSPATVTEKGASRCSPTPDKFHLRNSAHASRRPSGARRRTGQPGEEPKSESVESTAADQPLRSSGLWGWLCGLVGPEYHYVAADESFDFDSSTAVDNGPCLVFSDGVVLAHVISILERCRCSFLDCVRPTTKKAAKLFNVRRCLDFLRSNVGLVFDVPLLEEALMEGRGDGVASLLKSMRRHYHSAIPRSHIPTT